MHGAELREAALDLGDLFPRLPDAQDGVGADRGGSGAHGRHEARALRVVGRHGTPVGGDLSAGGEAQPVECCAAEPAGGGFGIGARIAEIRAGQRKLNRESDRDFFEKQAGLTPYALDNSPLIGLFAVPDQDAGDEEAEES